MKRFTDSRILFDGLAICLDRMMKMENESAIRNYLDSGCDDDYSAKEEVARLLLIATTKPSEKSPAEDLSKKIMERHFEAIDSKFLKEFLELREKTYQKIQDFISWKKEEK